VVFKTLITLPSQVKLASHSIVQSPVQIATWLSTGVPTLDTSHLVTVIVLVVASKVIPAQANVNVSKGHCGVMLGCPEAANVEKNGCMFFHWLIVFFISSSSVLVSEAFTLILSNAERTRQSIVFHFSLSTSMPHSISPSQDFILDKDLLFSSLRLATVSWCLVSDSSILLSRETAVSLRASERLI
jgi:hypothetical protein